jgi:hypothetical protein
MEVFTAATLVALALKITSTVKYAKARDWWSIITQAVAWAAGVGVVWLAAEAQAVQDVVLWSTVTAGSLDIWSIVLAGLALGSSASFGRDALKAVDNTTSTAEPSLGG